ncbi:MAG TPA: polysaccharide deacetylase family protein [Methylocystis sp.]|nr:polysaccharide deacetylase family protein [Methylocystis sp.]
MSFTTRLRSKANGTLARALATRTVSMRNARPVVSFTFDDFPKSAALCGARLIERHGGCGTFYCASSFCGVANSGETFFDADDLAALTASGHEIGCHTASHLRVSTCARAQLEQDLERNARFVAERLGDVRLSTFAYPFGDIGLGAKLQLQGRFAACRSSFPGLNRGVADLGALKAERLYSGRVDAASVERSVEAAASANAWLIFYTHDVSEDPSAFGCTPTLLETALKAANAAGCEILTVRNALGRIAFRPASGQP